MVNGMQPMLNVPDKNILFTVYAAPGEVKEVDSVICDGVLWHGWAGYNLEEITFIVILRKGVRA
jgi:hypothetical protein